MTLALAFALRSVIVALVGFATAQFLMRKGPAYVALAYKATFVALLTAGLLSFAPISPSAHALRIPENTKAVRTETMVASKESMVSTSPAKVHLPKKDPAGNQPLQPGAILVAFWLLGVALLLLRVVAAQLSMYVLSRQSTNVKDPAAALILSRLCSKKGVPALLTHSSVLSPFLAGVLHHSIYIPQTMIGDVKLEAVLAHEMVHLERNDCFWKLMERLTSAVLWFNPFVWLICRRFDESIEEYCDQVVISRGLERPVYARALLELATQAQTPAMTAALSTGVVDLRSSVARRVSLVLDASKKTATVVSRKFRLLAAPAAALVAIGVSVMISGEAAAQMSPNEMNKDRAMGMSNAKNIDLAMVMYTNDYDDELPYANDMETVKAITLPYIDAAIGISKRMKDATKMPKGLEREAWHSHNPNHSEFLFNMAIGGVELENIPDQTSTVQYYESKPWPDGSRIVGFVDGHVKIEVPDEWNDSNSSLAEKFKRTAKKPLPHMKPDWLGRQSLSSGTFGGTGTPPRSGP